jgi:uncharacterized protein
MTTGEQDQARPVAEVETPAGPTPGLTLRDPANRVCRRAIAYWTVESLIYYGLLMVAASVVYFVVLPERWWWVTALYVLLAIGFVIDAAVKPRWRYAVHRWEVTPTAVYTRTGWLSREQRIAPLSRVQTVDSKRGALMRLFRLASITVTTASAAGPISIVALDEDEAERVVAELTEITGRIEGDAT